MPISPTPSPSPNSYRIAVAGDIAQNCDASNYSVGAEHTAAIIRGLRANLVVANGDLSYNNAWPCFVRHWGAFNIFPVLGNHEYDWEPPPIFVDLESFFRGDTLGYGFHAVTNFPQVALLRINSNRNYIRARWEEQLGKLRRDLTNSQDKKCTFAFWHHARWGSGRNGDSPDTQEFINLLDDAKAEAIVWSHEHYSAVYLQRDKNGKPQSGGLNMYTAGGGGAENYRYTFGKSRVEADWFYDIGWAVLLIEIFPDGRYRIEFYNTPGGQPMPMLDTDGRPLATEFTCR